MYKVNPFEVHLVAVRFAGMEFSNGKEIIKITGDERMRDFGVVFRNGKKDDYLNSRHILFQDSIPQEYKEFKVTTPGLSNAYGETLYSHMEYILKAIINWEVGCTPEEYWEKEGRG